MLGSGRQRLGSALAVALVGCGGGRGGVDAQAQGELGNGTFDYFCSGPADPVCHDGLEYSSFPRCVVLGSSFGVEFEGYDSQFEDVRVETVSSWYLRGATSEFTADLPGRAALVATDGENRVVDMLHLDIVPATGLTIWQDGKAPLRPLPVAAGSKVELEVVPEASCSPLGGSIDVTVETSDADVAYVAWEADGLEIRGRAPGIAFVTIHAGLISEWLTVQVTDAPQSDEGEDDGVGDGPHRIPPEDTDYTVTAGETEGEGDTDTDGETG
jgi:hypothetical protein